MNRLKVSSLGPIKEADISFGELTIMVGPQASGKSILLQLIKLIVDKKNIRDKVEQYGFLWGKSKADILDRYFGEGMAGIWNNETKVKFNGKEFPLSFVLPGKGKVTSYVNEHYLFYIPAQRIICLQNGWPRFFNDYDDSVPFVLREFSETIRLFADQKVNNNNNGFLSEQEQGLTKQVKQSFDDTIFHQAEVYVDTTGKKRFKLDIGDSGIPFTVWSAGQKEFMPLLLSFYYLCPADELKSRPITRMIILEEPEMGLHPQAIKSVLLQILDLMQRGYEVILSTHSPVILEFAWALTNLQKSNAGSSDLAELFGLSNITDDVKAILEHALGSTVKTYFFDRRKDGVIVRDISSLDAGSEDEAIAEWGGLTSFSSKAVDIVSNSVSHE